MIHYIYIYIHYVFSCFFATYIIPSHCNSAIVSRKPNPCSHSEQSTNNFILDISGYRHITTTCKNQYIKICHLYICVYLCMYPSIRLSYLCISLSVSIYPSIIFVFISICIPLSIYPSICPSIHLSIDLDRSRSIYIYLYLLYI